MPKYHFDIIQNSDQWDALHLGIPTASEMKRIITPEGKSSAQHKAYANRLIAEKILKRQVDTAIADSPWMLRGKELEAEAVDFYELQTDRDTQLIGFVTTDDGLVGCSPDRLIGEDGLLELKCPAPQTQIDYLLDGDVSKEYKPQLQGQLFVTGRSYVDICSYHPELPPSILRVERDAVYLRIMEELLGRFNEYIADSIIKIAGRMQDIRRKPDAIEQLLGSGE